MKTFKNFIIENFLAEEFDISKTERGSHIYTSTVGDHKITTSFFNRSTERSVPGRYEITVVRQGPKDEKPTDMFRGRTNIPPEHRIRAALAVRQHVNHFITNNKPYELVAGGNTQRKRDMYRGVFDSIGKKHGAQVSHSDSYSGIRFKPSSEEQASKETQIKTSNLEKIKAAIARRNQRSNDNI